MANGVGFITGFKANRLSANYSGPSDINIAREVFAAGATSLMFDANQNMWVAASTGDRDTDSDTRFNPLGKKCSDRTGALVKVKPSGPSGYDSTGRPWPAMVIGDESSSEVTPNNIYAGGYPCLGMNYDGRNVRDTTGVAIDTNGGIWAANAGLHPDQSQYYW